MILGTQEGCKLSSDKICQRKVLTSLKKSQCYLYLAIIISDQDNMNTYSTSKNVVFYIRLKMYYLSYCIDTLYCNDNQRF